MLITWLKKFFKRKPKLVIEIYHGIDELFVFNFEKILDGKPEYLLHDHTLIGVADPVSIIDAYDLAMDEYCKELDIDLRDDDYFIYIQKRIQYRDQFIQGDKSAMNFIRYFDALIDEIKRNVIKPDFVKNRMAVAKWYRQPIDPKKTTVREFLKIHSLMMDEINAKKGKVLAEDESN